MPEQTVKSVTEASIGAVVVRADGSREDLGTVAYWHRNPLKRLAHRMTPFGFRMATYGEVDQEGERDLGSRPVFVVGDHHIPLGRRR